MIRVVIAASLLCLVAAAAGGSVGQESSLAQASERTIAELGDGWTGYAPAPGGSAAPCSEEDGRPISEGRARDALRGNGISVSSERFGPCVEGIVGELTNAPDDFKREGSVWCFLHERPGPDATTTVVRRGADGADAELVLQNLECTIFADSPTGEEKIDKLEAAFAELQRAIRP